MKNRFCPDCGGELFPISEVLYGCPYCVGTYEVIGDQVRRVYLGKQKEALAAQQAFNEEDDEDDGYYDDEEETDTTAFSPQPTNYPVQTPVVNTVPQPKQDNSFSHKSNFLIKKALVYLCVSAVIAAVLIAVSFAVKFTLAPILLILCGIAVFVFGCIMCAVMPKKARKICPCCGAKREHHRRWVNTTHKQERVSTTHEKTKFTHHYIDSYVCPNCGETGEYKVTGSGGETSFSEYGYIDKRIDPREF